MAWLAVYADGSEWIYELKPLRAYDSFVCDEDGDMASFVQLPKGSIKKLIGKELTWDDGPFKLEEELHETSFL